MGKTKSSRISQLKNCEAIQTNLGEQLQNDCDLLSGILNSSAAAIAVADLQGAIIFANQRAKEVLGLEKTQLIECFRNTLHWKISDFEGHPFTADQLPFTRVLKTQKAVFDIHCAIEQADYSRKYLSINAAPLNNSAEALVGVTFSISDITESYLAEKRLQEVELGQQKNLNGLLEDKVQERTVQLQKALEFGATLQRITEKVCHSLDENQILQTAVEELRQVLRISCCDTRIYEENQIQSVTSLQCTIAQPILNVDFNTAEISDIYHQLMQGQPIQVCPVLPNLDYAANHLPMVMICPIFDDQGFLGIIRLYREYQNVFNELEMQLVRQVANQCAIAIRQSRLYQAAQAQVEELANLNRLKTDFLSTVSHELRTPLSSIKMAIEMLEIVLRQLGILAIDEVPHQLPANKKVEQCLTILRGECDREINLITDILTLQQLEAGTQPFIPSTILLQNWIQQVVETFEETASSRNQHLQTRLFAELPPITTDLFMFDRVLGELLTNASKFTPAGEAIIVTADLVVKSPAKAEYEEQTIQIQVINTGVEIPNNELDRIFQPFYRIPSNDPWRYGGTGMGLALLKRLVANLGGSIWSESSAGQTCFTVQLPLQKATTY